MPMPTLHAAFCFLPTSYVAPYLGCVGLSWRNCNCRRNWSYRTLEPGSLHYVLLRSSEIRREKILYVEPLHVLHRHLSLSRLPIFFVMLFLPDQSYTAANWPQRVERKSTTALYT